MAELGVALVTFAPARTQDFVSLGRARRTRATPPATPPSR